VAAPRHGADEATGGGSELAAAGRADHRPLRSRRGTDAIARILATGLSKSAGYQIVIENKGGGSTNIGTEAVAHAAPDGYTILFCSLPFAINRFLFTTLGYDSFADFAPVTLLATYPDLMAVPTTSPARSVAEFIAYAKANGGKTTFASSGTGTSPHLAGELFKRRAGIELTHIPYRTGPAITDVIGGRVDVTFNTFGATLSLVREGQLRGLAVTSAKRFPAAPELPTIAETALPGFDVTAWYALFVPGQDGADRRRRGRLDPRGTRPPSQGRDRAVGPRHQGRQHPERVRTASFRDGAQAANPSAKSTTWLQDFRELFA
jgi:tripartite-type tricarboxylate transporter receptor subunit TctC